MANALAQPDLLLSLDPSSTKTGWAVFSIDNQLREAGLLTPDKTRAASEFRIGNMCRDLLELLNQVKPTVVIIEYTSGHVGANRHKGAGAGLAVYGVAVGALWQTVEHWRWSPPAERQGRTMIELVTENDWTRGVPKGDRQAAIAAELPKYSSEDDPGGDVADAIGLGIWWLREQRFKILQGALS